MGAVCAALDQTGLGPGISHENIQALNTYWSQIRVLYAPFEANVRASDSGVFDHEMPGGQYTNLQFQASQLGLGTQWIEIKKKYIEANQLVRVVCTGTVDGQDEADLGSAATSSR